MTEKKVFPLKARLAAAELVGRKLEEERITLESIQDILKKRGLISEAGTYTGLLTIKEVAKDRIRSMAEDRGLGEFMGNVFAGVYGVEFDLILAKNRITKIFKRRGSF